jgi:hypothetical protein
MTESLQEKAHRILLSGRLTVVSVVGQTIEARAEGDHGVYRLGYQAPGGWWCECARRQLGGRGRACSHLAALALWPARRPGSGGRHHECISHGVGRSCDTAARCAAGSR